MVSFTIGFEPVGRRISISTETDLLTAAQEAGVALTTFCGGIGDDLSFIELTTDKGFLESYINSMGFD